MKTLNFSILCLIFLLVGFTAQAERSVKKVYKSYSLSQVQTLNLDNKYGNINISESRKDSVIIDVVIWVDGTNDKAKRLLDKINVEVSHSGNSVTAATVFDTNFSSNQEFSIDYNVSIPADRNLNVIQKYGTVNMVNLTGKGSFEIKYGELRAKNLLSPDLNMDIAYSKVNATATNDLNLILRYSKFYLDKGRNFNLDTRYSTVEIGEGQEVTSDSKYDNMKFTSLTTLRANSMYTGISVEKLTRKLEIVNGYGGISVGFIPSGFESINIVNRYAGIKLGIASDASYKLDGSVRYCSLNHPDGKFTNRMRENNSYRVQGTIGSSDSPKSVVKVESSYGNVNLHP